MKTLLLILSVTAGLTILGSAEHPRAEAARVARGEYLVRSIGCADCHTPWKMGPNGPEPDESRAYSGHPQDVPLTAAPEAPPAPWGLLGHQTMTAWAGPWGVSFTANLTPDQETGLGSWREEEFIAALRTGRHRGMGREILPPMPANFYRNLSDEDLGSIFAYLQSLPAIANRVPEPLPPTAGS